MAAREDLTGQVFGRLTAVEPDESLAGAGAYWRCRCECGNEKSVRAGNLKSGQVQSCGCLRKETVAVTDMVGKRFGRLVAIERAGSVDDKAMWRFRCDCGKEVVLPGSRARSGGAKSCGCQRSDSAKLMNRKHGMAHTLAYKRWESIRQRCFNPKNPSYKNYGGRGITMCDEWVNSFDAFYAYIGDCPEGKSLDRIDNDRGYEPGNVRWLDRSGQMRNRRPLRPFTKRAIDHLMSLGWTLIPPEGGQ